MATKHHIIAFNSVNLLLIAIRTPFADTAKPIVIRVILITLIISASFHSAVASSPLLEYHFKWIIYPKKYSLLVCCIKMIDFEAMQN